MRTKLLASTALAVSVLMLAACGSSTDDAGAQSSSHQPTAQDSTENGSPTSNSAPSTPPESSAGESAAEVEGLLNAGELSVCIDPEYKPLEYYEGQVGSKIIGADADSARALAKQLGLTLKFVTVAFDGLVPGLVNGRCDLQLGGLYISAKRLEVLDAVPFMKAGPMIIVNKSISGEVQKPSDLCGRTVAAQSASANAQKAHDISDQCKADGQEPLKISEYPDTSSTVIAVVNGKSDALIETNVGAAYIVSQNKDTLELAPDVFPLDTRFGAYVKKGNPIKQSIADGLKALQEDGTLGEIMKKYDLDPSIVDVDQEIKPDQIIN